MAPNLAQGLGLLEDTDTPCRRNSVAATASAETARAVSSSASAGHSKPEGGVDEVLNLEQQFEADFATHLEKASQKRQLRFGALGAGVASAIGVAASPLLIPGLAVAAVAGGAGGYQLGKRKGKHQVRRHAQASRHVSDRPTLRRLKYLVKWGHWQLLEYEEASSELRAAVLDEVVRAFSPWVQRLYLLSAHRGGDGWSPSTKNPEIREVIQHLTPLCLLLKRRAALKALEQATDAVGTASLLGTLDSRHVDRCRIVFPTILETVSFFVGTGTSAEAVARPDVKQRRLCRSATAIREVLERPDVVQALSTWHGPTRAVSGVPGVPTVRHDGLEVPPEGTENEIGAMEDSGSDSDDLDYYSCSGESGDEAPATRPAALSGGSPDRGRGKSQFHKRLGAFRQGHGEHSWRPADEAVFEVRGATYLTDKKKVFAGPSLLELANIDFIRIGANGPIERAAEHPDLYPRLHRSKGDKRFLFIQNWIFPPYQAIIVGVLDPNAPWLLNDSPQARSWHRFLAASEEERKNLFKIIMAVEEGPWLVKRAVPKKPVRPGRPLKMHTYHQEGDHFEVVVDVSSGRTEQVATGLAMRALKSLKLSMATLIEATKEDELPEAVIQCVGMKNVNTSLLSCPAENV